MLYPVEQRKQLVDLWVPFLLLLILLLLVQFWIHLDLKRTLAEHDSVVADLFCFRKLFAASVRFCSRSYGADDVGVRRARSVYPVPASLR